MNENESYKTAEEIVSAFGHALGALSSIAEIAVDELANFDAYYVMFAIKELLEKYAEKWKDKNKCAR